MIGSRPENFVNSLTGYIDLKGSANSTGTAKTSSPFSTIIVEHASELVHDKYGEG